MTPLEIFLSICRAQAYNPDQVICKLRNAKFAKQRRHVAQQLRAHGLSYPEIGRVMNRDHTTVQYMCKDEYRADKKFKMRARSVHKKLTAASV